MTAGVEVSMASTSTVTQPTTHAPDRVSRANRDPVPAPLPQRRSDFSPLIAIRRAPILPPPIPAPDRG
ncbi:hypothetical protein GCM10027598_12020 [Amycolatopsis oliviviridis]|uniref:Uncharacterized protein n=1 Tax=Amycolatopsis oliviviridis TaxID=1471590 RepID=A0ABQ3LV09_9PSEU|nr:hypothetical protein GCM10017790_54110 [Amycolatopsis oliviviridis]